MLELDAIPAAGWSEMVVSQVGGRSRLTRCRDIAPLKSFNPRTHGVACQIMLSTYGGGMVQGDRLGLHLHAEANTTTMLGTQAHTRIYHNHDGRLASQFLHGDVDENAFMVHLPDPVVAHVSSRFSQAQAWRLHSTATLVSLDWFVSGRTGIDERFALATFESSVHVVVDEVVAAGSPTGERTASRPVVSDSLRIEPDDLAVRNALVFAGYDQLFTLYLVGPRAADLHAALEPAITKLGMVATTPLAVPGTAGFVVRAMARERAELTPLLRVLTNVLARPEWLGFDCWRGKL